MATRHLFHLWLPVWLVTQGFAFADDLSGCFAEKLKTANPSLTVGELRDACADADQTPTSSSKRRLIRERDTQWSPYILTGYKQNYILAYTHVDGQNPIYAGTGDQELSDRDEAKMQISIKIPLTHDALFVEGDSVHFGFTMKSFWQVYNSDVSAPFRETNYQPEFFYTMPLRFRPDGTDTALRLGLEHESNGRSQPLSRSWNRVYAQLFYAKDNYLVSFRPWYRIPEDDKNYPADPGGDDNPAIDDYMGYFELNGVMTYRDLEFSTLLRNNLRSQNYGAVEMGVSFPLWGRVRGYAQYFNGYGESLVDYNHRTERYGLGFLITDLM